MKKKLTYAALAALVFGGAVTVSEAPVIEKAHAECGSIWAGCSESEVSETQTELEEI